MSPLEIVAPVFALMFLGYGLGWTRFFPPDAARALMRFVWYVAIPALMFRSLAGKAIPNHTEAIALFSYYAGLYGLYVLTALMLYLFFRIRGAQQALLNLSAVFSNGGFIGIPVIESAYGPEGLRILLLILSFHSMTLVPLTTFLVVKDQQSDASALKILVQSIKHVLESPLIIALILGMAVSILDLHVPDVLMRFVNMPADAAAPCGLFAAGAALAGVRLQGDLAPAIFLSIVKLILLPVFIYISGIYIFHIDAFWVTIAVVFASMPTGAVAYSMAENYGVAARRSASVVLISTGLSMLTISLVMHWIS